jgi:6-pyruvoyltetrahydropterin/6-carboxytetrahydropterin synthase
LRLQGGRVDNPYVHTTTKSYKDLPAAHRQHNHKGHCSQIHGHNWAFDITFHAKVLDENKFVLDVGQLGFVKDFLADTFDHTFLLNADDPFLADLRVALEHDSVPFAKIVVVNNCGMEALAEYVFVTVNNLLAKNMADDVINRALRVCSVTCWEDSKNRSTWSMIPAAQYT